MANRVPGVFSFSANFEALIAAPLDARGTVMNYSELTNSSLPYPYLGMVVAVTSDSTPSNNGLYILKAAPATISSNWYKLSEGTGTTTTITGVTYNGTVQTIGLSDGSSFTTDINNTELNTTQYSVGISNHSYELINISTTTTTIVVSGTTYDLATPYYSNSGGVAAAKMNIIVVDGITSSRGFLLEMPNLASNEAGVIYKIIAKDLTGIQSGNYFMVYSETNRIIGANIKSKVGSSYFVPLEALESLELTWDGTDYIITNIIKQGYTSLNAKNFLFLNTGADPLFDNNYIERDINNII